MFRAHEIKLIVKEIFFTSSWLNTEINISKLFYLHSHLVFYKPNSGNVGEEYEESYHTSIETMDKT